MCTHYNFSAGHLVQAVAVTLLQEIRPHTGVTIFRKVQSYDVYPRYLELLLVKIQFRNPGSFYHEQCCLKIGLTFYSDQVTRGTELAS